jgi:hypothetical protein
MSRDTGAPYAASNPATLLAGSEVVSHPAVARLLSHLHVSAVIATTLSRGRLQHQSAHPRFATTRHHHGIATHHCWDFNAECQPLYDGSLAIKRFACVSGSVV